MQLLTHIRCNIENEEQKEEEIMAENYTRTPAVCSSKPFSFHLLVLPFD